MAKPPKLSDPGGSPRFPFQREAKRQAPIWVREQFGPWRCDVRVVPITGLRRAYALFEVSCRWEQGPPLDESHGPGPPWGMAAVDLYVVDAEAPDMRLTPSEAQELAVELAKHAADLLEQGVKPDLNRIARELRGRR